MRFVARLTTTKSPIEEKCYRSGANDFLRRHFPDARISWIVEDRAADLLLDRFVPVDDIGDVPQWAAGVLDDLHHEVCYESEKNSRQRRTKIVLTQDKNKFYNGKWPLPVTMLVYRRNKRTKKEDWVDVKRFFEYQDRSKDGEMNFSKNMEEVYFKEAHGVRAVVRGPGYLGEDQNHVEEVPNPFPELAPLNANHGDLFKVRFKNKDCLIERSCLLHIGN